MQNIVFVKDYGVYKAGQKVAVSNAAAFIEAGVAELWVKQARVKKVVLPSRGNKKGYKIK
jgi:hypothetical protein